jgi:hypothetical protein
MATLNGSGLIAVFRLFALIEGYSNPYRRE